jgi:dihydroneopterin aldolase
MGQISIKNIRVYAFHGCMDEEGLIGGDYLVDIDIAADLRKACDTDNLHDTIDYVDINRIVQEEMGLRSKLIEHVAARILKRLQTKFPNVDDGAVTVTKLSPPMGGHVDSVSITLKIKDL